MTAPFPLPDEITVYNGPWTNGSIRYPNMPCRLVPAWRKDRPSFNDPDTPNWFTHWIDFDPQYVLEASVSSFEDEDSLVWAQGDELRRVLTLPGAAGELRETYWVVWVEERYTGTATWHRRAYLIRNGTEFV